MQVQLHYLSFPCRPVWIPTSITSNTVFMGENVYVPTGKLENTCSCVKKESFILLANQEIPSRYSYTTEEADNQNKRHDGFTIKQIWILILASIRAGYLIKLINLRFLVFIFLNAKETRMIYFWQQYKNVIFF